MSAEPVSLAEYRIARAQAARKAERLPLALNVHIGAVELILGSPLDENATEVWLSPEQAIELGHDLIRTGEAAKGSKR